MITKFEIDTSGQLTRSEQSLSQAVWIDILTPTQEEYDEIQQALGIDLPLHQELLQLEYSSRFYQENHALFLSAVVVTKVSPLPESHTISFIVTEKQIITMRFSDPNPIKNFIEQMDRHTYDLRDHIDILIYLLEVLVGRVADIFELFEEKTELMGLGLKSTVKRKSRSKNANILNSTLHEIIDLENVISKCYQSLSSLQMLIGFFVHGIQKHKIIDGVHRFDSLKQDITSMMTQADFLNQKLEFQLDSTLGLINIEQTHIIKTFTVLAMIFMPPTLIASIYGMNFHHMPELDTTFGYPIALIMMVVSGLFPYYLFKRKGWL